MSETAKQLLARIEALDTAAADNRVRAESYSRMAEELKDAQGHGSSPDGVVSVVAGPGGTVTSVTFSERARETPPEVLSADVMRAITEAQASAARLQAEVVRRGLGGTELLDRVLDSDEQLFGAPRTSVAVTGPSPAGPAQPAAANRRPEGEDDFSFEEFSVYDGKKAR
jgi:DNA-binding protein YbaB